MLRTIISISLLLIFCAAAFGQNYSGRQPIQKQKPVATPARELEIKEDFFDTYYVNVGIHTEFYKNIQIDTSGGTNTIDFNPTLGMGLKAPLKNNFNFMPEFNWVLPRKSGASAIIKNLFMLRADLAHDTFDWLRLRVGTSVMWLNQHGQGGSTKVNNGDGTSTFYYPDENRSSLNNTLDLGAEFLWDDWALRLQTYTYALFKEERRQLSYTLFVSYYWE
jgi:hypothetical protein